MTVHYDTNASFDVDITDVEYLRHGDEPLLARIYQPKGAGPFPALLEVHGGAWSDQDRTRSEHSVLALARSGIVVASIDFRLAPAHPYPAQLQDINYGVRWLKAHAADFNADPSTVGGYGSSSGGHTIVLAGMRAAFPWYNAIPLADAREVDASLAYVIAQSGIVDPYARYQYAVATSPGSANSQRLARNTLGFFLTEDGMREGNPQLILERGEPAELPPLLLVQSDQDANIPWQIVEKFGESYRKAGGVVEWRLYRGQPHVFANSPGAESDAAVAAMKAFIARHVNAPAVVR